MKNQSTVYSLRPISTKYIPELEKLIHKGEESSDENIQKAAGGLKALLDETLNTDNHKWYLNKMSEKQLAIRKAATEEFKKKYGE